MLRILLFCLINLSYIASSQGLTIIRDSEIEETINLIIKPLKQAANLPNLKIHLISDPAINAFTTGGNDIFIHSGLITEFPDPDILRGVVAHEIGHIKGNHIIRKDEIIRNYQKAALAASILGLAASVSRPDASMATAFGAMHLAERSILAYSRSFESSADQVALQLLEQVGHSAVGMVTFFKKIGVFSNNDSINPYEQTHPLSEQRLAFITDYQQNSPYKYSQNDAQLIAKYQRSAAKLWAFTSKIKDLEYNKYEKYGQDIALYVKTIKNFRLGDFQTAIKIIEQLINKNPDDAYYHELKGQIYHEFGRDGAIKEYKLAKQIKPNDLLIRLGLGVAGIDRYQNNANEMQSFVEELNYVLSKEPTNIIALYYLSIYYRESKLEGKSYLNTALISLLSGRKAEAKKMAKLALPLLPKNSVDWYKAGDILAATK